jgi:hypothetical protein
MKMADKPGQSLIAKFEEVRIDLQVGDCSLCPPGEDDAQVIEYIHSPAEEPYIGYYHFFISSLDGMLPEQYKEMIEKLLKCFFDEVDDLVLNVELPFTNRLNTLINYRFHFNILRNQYKLIKIPPLNEDFVTCEQLRIEKDFDKLTDPASIAMSASYFLEHQVNVLDRILPLLDVKIEFLETMGNKNSFTETRSQLVWQKNINDLTELVRALKLSGAINNSTNTLTLTEAYRFFGNLFGIEIKKPEDQLREKAESKNKPYFLEELLEFSNNDMKELMKKRNQTK